MIFRQELEQFLQETFQYGRFQDSCQNGLQIEGKPEIETIAFGVSFHLPLIEQAIQQRADAIIVHHGIFGKDFFTLTGTMREKIRLLLQHDMSLFGIHLPLDAHEQFGNNAELLRYLGAEIAAPFEVGYFGHNSQEYSLAQMLDIFHDRLHPEGFLPPFADASTSRLLAPTYRHGFLAYANGLEIPRKLAVLSGSAAREYRPNMLRDNGVDTYICGSVSEATAAISLETRTNFVNLGHYWSEKPGVLALKTEIEYRFGVNTVFLEVENII